MTMDASRLGLAAAVIAGVLVFNFVPTLIAYATRHPERRLLASLNVASLLSLLLWLALLAWAVGGKRDDSVIGRFAGDPANRRRLLIGAATLIGLGVASTAYALALR